MIFIGSAILFIVGMLLLLRSTIIIAYHLVELAMLLVALCGCVLALAVTGCLVVGDWIVRHIRGAEPELISIEINIVDGGEPNQRLHRAAARQLPPPVVKA
jgi:hypothetical protein